MRPSPFEPEPRPEFLPRLEDLPAVAPVTLLTLRVSADGGRTWDKGRAVRSDDSFNPFLGAEWPPCGCARCA